MNFLYNIGINIYKAAVSIAALHHEKAKKMLRGQALTFATLEEKLDYDSSRDLIWIHASSLGEFEQGRPLIEMIKRDKPNARILLSFFSPSGYEVRKDYNLADVVVYLPMDTPANAKRFVETVKPTMAIFVKYEFWGNYLQQLKAHNVPTYIVSAIFRPSQIFFKPWGGMFREILKCYTRIFVQNEESRLLLKDVGVTNVEVGGDTRFDRVKAVREAAREFPVIARMVSNGKFTLVVGSSWQPDEDVVIPYFNSHPDINLIIAPHEFDKERLAQLQGRINGKVSLYSMTPENEAESTQCLIIDCFGILSSLYRYAHVAMVGGGFGAGIHNVNEAAVYGIPVIYGPKYGKFKEASDLIACGGAYCVHDADEFAAIVDKLRTDANLLRQSGNVADKYIKSHLGATGFIYNSIFPRRAGDLRQTETE